MGRDKKYVFYGSITVEAAYLVPFLLMLIFAVMEVSFYLHDISILSSVIERNVKNYVNLTKHPYLPEEVFYCYRDINERSILSSFSFDKEREQECMQAIEQELLSSFMTLRLKSVKVNIKKKKLTAEVSVIWKTKLSILSQYLDVFGKGKKVKYCVHSTQTEDFARMLETVIGNYCE